MTACLRASSFSSRQHQTIDSSVFEKDCQPKHGCLNTFNSFSWEELWKQEMIIRGGAYSQQAAIWINLFLSFSLRTWLLVDVSVCAGHNRRVEDFSKFLSNLNVSKQKQTTHVWCWLDLILMHVNQLKPLSLQCLELTCYKRGCNGEWFMDPNALPGQR